MVKVTILFNMNIDYQAQKITFDSTDWFDGVEYLNIDDNYERGTKGLAYVESFNPYRRFGYAVPGHLPESATNESSVAATIRQGVVKGSDTAYLLENGAKFHKLTGLTGNGTIATTGGFPHTIVPASGNSPTGLDIVKYYQLVGGVQTEYIWYSHTSDAVWNIGRFDSAGPTWDDVYMTATATTPMAAGVASGGVSFPHPLVAFENNKLYAGDRNFVHMYDGQTNVFTAAVLTLPSDYVVTAFAKVNFYLVVFAYKNNTSTTNLGESTAFFWDTFSQSFTVAKDLNDFYVSEAINYKNTVMCFTSGLLDDLHSGNLRIKMYDGQMFNTITTYSSTSGQGGQSFVGLPVRGGVQTQGEDVYFNAGGKIFKLSPQGEQWKLFEYYSDFTNSTPGFLRFLRNTFNLFFSNAGGTGGGLRTLRQNFNIGAAYTKVAELEFPPRKRARTKAINVYYKTTTSGGRTFELHYLPDAVDTTIRSDHAVPATTSSIQDTSAVERWELDVNNSPLLPFKTMQLHLIWTAGSGSSSAPEISKIEVEFELFNL